MIIRQKFTFYLALAGACLLMGCDEGPDPKAERAPEPEPPRVVDWPIPTAQERIQSAWPPSPDYFGAYDRRSAVIELAQGQALGREEEGVTIVMNEVDHENQRCLITVKNSLFDESGSAGPYTRAYLQFDPNITSGDIHVDRYEFTRWYKVGEAIGGKTGVKIKSVNEGAATLTVSRCVPYNLADSTRPEDIIELERMKNIVREAVEAARKEQKSRQEEKKAQEGR